MNKKTAVSKTTNEDNLRYFSKLLVEIEHFVFFGTMLGLVRDGKIIEWDDDVDIYVNSNQRNALIELLENAEIKLNFDEYPNNTPHILQVKRLVGSEIGLVDFYFYDADSDPKYIWEKWNFHGNYKNIKNAIKIPKKHIFPIVQKVFGELEVSVPKNSQYLCKFLYGKRWNRPLTKGAEYAIRIINNKPRVFVGRLGKIELKFLNVLKRLLKG